MIIGIVVTFLDHPV